MMETLAVIIAYGGGQKTFDRLWRHWAPLPADLMVVSPEDAPVVLNSEQIPRVCRHVMVGRSGHHGAVAGNRLKKLFDVLAAVRSYDFYILGEYDSCLLGGEIPRPILEAPRGLWAYVAGWTDPPFQSPWFVHPPWMFDVGTFNQLWRRNPADAGECGARTGRPHDFPGGLPGRD